MSGPHAATESAHVIKAGRSVAEFGGVAPQSLVPVYLYRDLLLYSARLRFHFQEGLDIEGAERAASEDVLRDRPIIHALCAPLHITGRPISLQKKPMRRGSGYMPIHFTGLRSGTLKTSLIG